MKHRSTSVKIELWPSTVDGQHGSVIELKYNRDAVTALDQIRDRDYPDIIREYTDNILLVGISYDKESKFHTCKIERR